MTQEQYLKNLLVPQGRVDVILDTDAYNEIDDQFAIAYLLLHPEKFTVRGICAAPFHNRRSLSPEDGMNKSYEEIQKIVDLAQGRSRVPMILRGSTAFLTDEFTPCSSDAADFICRTSLEYSPEHPLYVIAIGAITNVASALLQEPAVKENCVIVWLGGHGIHIPDPACEFNMVQDIAAARIVFGSRVPLVQLPCRGVVDRLATSKYELEHWLKGKNALCDYLYTNTVKEAERYAANTPWTRVIWDVCAPAWFFNEKEHFLKTRLIPSPIPEYDREYAHNPNRHLISYVYHVQRDALFAHLFDTLSRSGL